MERCCRLISYILKWPPSLYLGWSADMALVQIVGFLSDYLPSNEAELKMRGEVLKAYGKL